MRMSVYSSGLPVSVLAHAITLQIVLLWCIVLRNEGYLHVDEGSSLSYPTIPLLRAAVRFFPANAAALTSIISAIKI